MRTSSYSLTLRRSVPRGNITLVPSTLDMALPVTSAELYTCGYFSCGVRWATKTENKQERGA